MSRSRAMGVAAALATSWACGEGAGQRVRSYQDRLEGIRGTLSSRKMRNIIFKKGGEEGKKEVKLR